MTRHIAVVILALATVSLTVVAGAQSPASGTGGLRFEVTSVKPNKSGDLRISFNSPPGRYEIVNAPLRQIIRIAHQIQDFQIVDAPAWIAQERFDILASINGVASPSERSAMLRNLLADRFGLRAHKEMRELPVFELVTARPDRALGPGAKPTDVDCAARAARSGGPAPAPPPGAPTDRPLCGLMMRPGLLMAGAMTMGEFAQALAPQVNRYVVDRTGVSGAFNFDVTYAPERDTPPPPGAPPLPPPDMNGPSLFTALQEQLGLRLNAARAPADVLVIDAVSQPTPD